MEVRQAIKCLSSATVEDFDLHSAQVDLALEEKREAMGNHAARMEWEAKDALRHAKSRLRQEAIDAVRSASKKIAHLKDVTLFVTLREELIAKQERLKEWLGDQAEAVAEDVRGVIHAAQVRAELLAAVEIRRKVQSMSLAVPETLESLRVDLEKGLVDLAGYFGAESEKLREEAKAGIEAGQRNARSVADHRAQQAREAAEAAKRTAEIGQEVVRIEGEAGSAIQAVATAQEQEDRISPEEALQAGKQCEEVLLNVRTELVVTQEKCQKMSLHEASCNLTMGEEMPRETEAQMMLRALMNNLHRANMAIEGALERVRAARERAARKAAAARKEREQRELFARFDANGDEVLSMDEITELGKAEYELDLPEEFFEKVKTALQSPTVAYEQFPRLRQMLAIERSEVRARQKRAEEEERIRREREEEERRQREIAERTAKATALLREGDDLLPDASSELTKVEVSSSEILVERDNLSSAKLLEVAAATESNMAPPCKELAAVRAKLDEALEVLGTDLANRLEGDVSDLRVRLERAEARATRLRLAVAKAREQAKDAAEKEDRLSRQKAKFAKLQRAYQEQEEEDDSDEGEWQS